MTGLELYGWIKSGEEILGLFILFVILIFVAHFFYDLYKTNKLIEKKKREREENGR